MTKLLIIDDDTDLCALLSEFLQLEGFSVSSIHNGAEAVRHLQDQAYDAIVLDIMLPGMQGLDVLRELRTFCHTPVLMLTARGEDTDRILGLELGADDYLPKPCNPRELSARLRAVLRRSQSSGTKNQQREKIVVGATCIDPGGRIALYDDKELGLTSAEFNVLSLLLANAGDVVDKERMSQEGLGRPLSAYDRSIDVHVSKIRKKLAAAGGHDLIASIRGIGYQFKLHSAETAR
jgi:DNA-binding response OmpR family regulator